jgi:hypothetical protein
MNRDKGFLRLAIVLAPVFGLGFYLIDKLLFPFRWGEQVADYGRFARWLSEIMSYAHARDFSVFFLTFVLGGSIPFLAYLGYRFVQEGFNSEGSSSEDKVGEEVQGEIDKLSELQTQLANLKELVNPEFATMIEDLREEIAWFKIQIAEKTNKYPS